MTQKETLLRGAMRVYLVDEAKTALPDSIKEAEYYNLYLLNLFEDTGEALLVARGAVEDNSAKCRVRPVKEIFSCKIEDLRPVPSDAGVLVNDSRAESQELFG